MLSFRQFINTDIIDIVKIWRQQRTQRALAQAMSHDLMEQYVFSKPYFESAGIVVAHRGDEMVGYIHCGFGPTKDRSDIDCKKGIICILLTKEGEDQEAICRGLIEKGEEYLRSRGSEFVTTGTDFPYSPFYLGLYGGSNVPGIVSDNQPVIELLKDCGYEFHDRILVMQRSLHGFRAVVDRQQTFVRRGYRIEHDQDPLSVNWWEACTLGNTNRSVFRLIERKTEQQVGHIAYWDMEPLARNWGIRAMGLFELSIGSEERHRGLGTFLLSESMRHMQQQAINMVEAQVAETNAPAVKLFEKMGFESIDTGTVLNKRLQAS